MGLNTRNDYIKFVESSYFGSVMSCDIEKIISCFTDDCLVMIRHGDNPARMFKKTSSSGEPVLYNFFEHLCGNYYPVFEDFTHFVDVDNSRSSCTFTVKLSPRPESDYLPAGEQTLNNCNFFLFREGLIKEMTIYYCNSMAGDTEPSIDRPTGYPK